MKLMRKIAPIVLGVMIPLIIVNEYKEIVQEYKKLDNTISIIQYNI